MFSSRIIGGSKAATAGADSTERLIGPAETLAAWWIEWRRMEEEKAGTATAQYARIIRQLDSLERITANLVRYGVSLRTDVRRHDKAIARIDANLERLSENLIEITDKSR